jgi:hypothetical protein
MIILANTTDSIQVLLSATVAANQLQCYAAFRDTTSSAITPSSRVVFTNNTTAVDLVQSPGSSTQRIVDFLSIQNTDTATQEVTVRFNDNGVTYILFKILLNTGEKIEYHDGKGFKVINSAGGITGIAEPGSNISNVGFKTIYLPTDLILTSSRALLSSDVVPGLEFPVVQDKIYLFKFFILYDVDATTTGVRFNVHNSSLTNNYAAINFQSLTASTPFVNYISTDFLQGTTSNTSAYTTQNCARVEGGFVAGSNGRVRLYAGHDVAAGATLTIKKGSMVQFYQLT